MRGMAPATMTESKARFASRRVLIGAQGYDALENIGKMTFIGPPSRHPMLNDRRRITCQVAFAVAKIWEIVTQWCSIQPFFSRRLTCAESPSATVLSWPAYPRSCDPGLTHPTSSMRRIMLSARVPGLSLPKQHRSHRRQRLCLDAGHLFGRADCGWRLVTDAVHAAEARCSCNFGTSAESRIRHCSQADLAGGASAIAPQGVRTFIEDGTFAQVGTPRALSKRVAGDHRRLRASDTNALAAGFDGVEIMLQTVTCSISSCATARTIAAMSTAVPSRIGCVFPCKSSRRHRCGGSEPGWNTHCARKPCKWNLR